MSNKPDQRLLEPGWPGLLTLDEALFIQGALRTDRMLRRNWHIRGESCPLSKIAERAFPEKPDLARRHITAEMATANRNKRALVSENVVFPELEEKAEPQKDTQLSLTLVTEG